MSDMTPLERMARAIYDAPTRFDGDSIGTHLSQSYVVDGSTSTAEDARSVVAGMCEDIARAALMAIREPSNDMLAPACKKHKPGEPMSESSPFECPAFTKRRSRWTAMIDHVLAQTPEPSRTCQKCAGRIEGWICQGCGVGYVEVDGRLISDTDVGKPITEPSID